MPRDENLSELLRARGIQPSVQRLAIAGFVLRTDAHPSADQVYQQVQQTLPVVSRATVYNTLRLFVERGLLSQHQLDGGAMVYDANVARHHHLIDVETGRVVDVPWDAVEVQPGSALGDYEVESFSVVIRGRRRQR